jgi:hypothetical protein
MNQIAFNLFGDGCLVLMSMSPPGYAESQNVRPMEVVYRANGDAEATARAKAAAKSPATLAAPPSAGLKKQFRDLAKQWTQDTAHLSSTVRMAKHPAYRQLVAMGPAVIPLLLAELKRNPDFWFAALREITGENPVSPASAGKLKEMAHAWVEWGRARGHI